MKLTPRWPSVLLCLLIGAGTPLLAFKKSDQPPLPNFDKRPLTLEPATPAKTQAAAQIGLRIKGLKIDRDERLGAIRHLASTDSFLTGLQGQGKGVSLVFSQQFPATDPHRPIKAFLQEHAGLFGHGPEVLNQARVKKDFIAAHNGLRTVVWEQQVDDIAVFEGLFVGHITQQGELVSVSSQMLPNAPAAASAGTPNRAALQSKPTISAEQAIVLAARNVGEELAAGLVLAQGDATGPEKKQRFQAPRLLGDTDAKLVWLPWKETLRLCWEVVLTSSGRGEMFKLVIDAATGEVLVRHCLTNYISDASYRVYTSDSPSPFSPGHFTLSTNQPPVLARTLVVTNAFNTNASPGGWIPDGENQTLGNNVDAHLDANNNNMPDLPRPQGSPNRVFDFALNLSQAPASYSSATVVQLFFLSNWFHDRLYELGFTEAAGNFQTDNFGRGGFGNDAVQADAQDGGGFNNANFSTPADGSPGRMQMYIFNGPNPDRDGSFDAEIVFHELAHGLSNRRVGNGVGISALQSAGMGEGWSDFYALCLLAEPGDDPAGNYAAGGYATYLFSGLTTNYYFGIRRYPYSTNLLKNPLTFKDIDDGQASSHAGIPRSPIIGGPGSEVHNQGEVWCSALWEVRHNLIQKHGFAIGNELVLQLVTDGMGLSPGNPNFLQSRDGILQADLVNNGGANHSEIWAGFAKRGMGFSSTAPASSTTAGVVEAFDLPDDLSITPSSGLTSTGPVGGPFNPSVKNYALTNSGSNTLTWSASTSVGWLTLSSSGGSLAAGAETNLLVSINSASFSLPMGTYTNVVTVSNLTSGRTQKRSFILGIGLPDYFTELFASGDNDLDNQSFLFQTNASSSFYSVCRSVVSSFPTDPAGGTVVSLSDDSFVQVNLTGGTRVYMYGTTNSSFYIGSNGYITFGSGDSDYLESLTDHFSLRRISAMFTDLDPGAGGTVTWKQLTNRIAVTYQNVRQYGSLNQNSFQIEMFFDGSVRVTYLSLGTQSSIAGLSRGLGIPANFIESDLSSYHLCLSPLTIALPASASEGAGVLPNQGAAMLTSALSSNLVVSLESSHTNALVVPATVTILAGNTNALFDLTLIDDQLLDGNQNVMVMGTAPGYVSVSATMTILDDDVATLHVNLPASATEGEGVLAGAGLLSISTTNGAPQNPTAILLNSSDSDEVQVPPVVIMPAGQTSVTFNVTIVDDSVIDGTQLVTVTAQVTNWISGQAIISVLDNENQSLHLTLPAQVYEGNGVLVNAGQVSLPGTLSSNLVVGLLSSDTTELVVPASVMIPAGQSNANFNLTIVDDALKDGAQSVTITASAATFTNGQATLSVGDNDVHQYVFASIPDPQQTGQSFGVTLSAHDINNVLIPVYNGTVALSGAGDGGAVVLQPTNTGAFSNGVWSGLVQVTTADADVRLTAADMLGNTGQSGEFDVLGELQISPTDGFFSEGPAGGPFFPTCAIYTLTNNHFTPLEWAATASHEWLTFTPANGILGAGAAESVTVCLNSNAYALPGDIFAGSLFFSNLTHGTSSVRPVQLTTLQAARLPFHETFENGGLPSYWQTSGTGTHRTLVTNALTPNTGSYHLVMDDSVTDTNFSRNELTLTINLEHQTNVVLTFSAKRFTSEQAHGPPTLPFVGGADFDGVAISVDGNTWYEVLGLRNLGTGYATRTVNLNSAIATNGLSYNSNFRIRFNHYDNSSAPTDGFAIDDILITGNSIVDHFQISTVGATQFVGAPFPISVLARTSNNIVQSNYSGRVSLEGLKNLPTNETVKILSFTRHAQLNVSYSNTLAALRSHFTNFVEVATTNIAAGVLASELSDKHVFLIPAQTGAPVNLFHTLGFAWANTLRDFVSRGGIVMACSYDQNEHLILKNSGILEIDRSYLPGITSCEIPSIHLLNAGVTAPFVATNVTTYFALNSGVFTAIKEEGLDEFIVLYRSLGLGNAVMIGTDFTFNGSALDRVLANAVKWAQTTMKKSVALTPTVSAHFTNGTWTGSVVVSESATNVQLRVSEAGRFGVGNLFSLVSNQAPFASNLSFTLQHNASTNLQLTGTDPDGQPLTFIISQLPTNGLMQSTMSSNGLFAYTPAHAFTGPDHFFFTVNDGALSSPAAQVTLTIISTADTDADGMPDAWENAHGLNPLVANGSADPDNDGYSNLQEYFANSDPMNPDSRSLNLTVTKNSMGHSVLNWRTVGATRYRIQYSDGTGPGNYNGNFNDLILSAEEEIDSASYGAPSNKTFTDDFILTGGTPTQGVRFYRIKIIQ